MSRLGGVVALLVVLCSCGGSGGPEASTAAAEPTATVDCTWAEDSSNGVTLTYLDAPVTITSPVALDWIEVQVEALDTDGSVLPRGSETERFEQVSAVSPRTFDHTFGATLGWPQDVTCTATVMDYFAH
jgi:hypothetical protein